MREIYRTVASNGDNVLNLAAKSDFRNMRENVDQRSDRGRGRLSYDPDGDYHRLKDARL